MIKNFISKLLGRPTDDAKRSLAGKRVEVG